jgi:hypothetical protein
VSSALPKAAVSIARLRAEADGSPKEGRARPTRGRFLPSFEHEQRRSRAARRGRAFVGRTPPF